MKNTEEAVGFLKNSRLFKGFSPNVIEAIAPMLQTCEFSADNLICLKGDESDCLYIIRKGEVEISVSSSDGKIIILGTLSDGDVFGEIGLLDGGTRTASVAAKTDTSLYRLCRKDFDTLATLFGVEELKALTSYICLLFRRATNSLEETAFMDADVRIVRKLHELYQSSDDKSNNHFKLSISQEGLGRMVGLSREASNKALSHLEDKGLIERQYKAIFIPDIKRFIEFTKTT